MAALVGGRTYGLSSHDQKFNSKTLVFVKLTDSALKSIEEYVNNKNNSAQKATIQFKSNNGVIRLPNSDSHVKSYGFNFSNVETDGPQGSFECLREEGSRSLESLGCMLYKMHINANEDSYEKTRVKMAAVEKENKKFCTKEIKPSAPFVGRKVKVKHPTSSIPPKAPSPLYLSPQSSKTSSKQFINSVPATSANQLSSSVNPPRQVNGTNKNTRNTPEIKSQSCRSRIIHLLALRPYKKPELMSKLLNEGIKEKEKKCITAILTQVAVLKDHSYNLASHMWNEVQDDWKFYTEEEVNKVRTKKYHILGLRNERISSPISHHPSNSPNQKRALSEWETNNDQRNKKQRISHLNRQSNAASSNSNSSSALVIDFSNGSTNSEKCKVISHNMGKDMNGHTNGDSSDSLNSKWASSSGNYTHMNGHSQKVPSNYENDRINNESSFSQRTSNGAIYQNGKSKQPYWLSTSSKDNKTNVTKPKFPNADSERTSTMHSVNPVGKTDTDLSNQSHYGKSNGTVLHSDEVFPKNYNVPNTSLPLASGAKKNIVSDGKKPTNGYYHNGYTSGNHHISNSSSKDVNSSDVVISEDESDSSRSLNLDLTLPTDPLEYVKHYPAITSKEQRARYKEDFNSEYESYKILYNKVKKIANKFDDLEDRLNRCTQDGTDSYNVRKEIMNLYQKYRGHWYLEGKNKLHFLHEKLSHIKKLVMEYDRSSQTISS